MGVDVLHLAGRLHKVLALVEGLCMFDIVHVRELWLWIDWIYRLGIEHLVLKVKYVRCHLVQAGEKLYTYSF